MALPKEPRSDEDPSRKGPKTLRVLVIEDDEDDALLVVGELERCGWEVAWQRVDTSGAMAEALDRSPFDLIVSDYRMPSFRAPEALALWEERGLETPFIVVSGTIGEEHAVEVLKAGARDFFLKDRLSRLCSAVERELRAFFQIGFRGGRLDVELTRAHEGGHHFRAGGDRARRRVGRARASPAGSDRRRSAALRGGRSLPPPAE